MKIAILGASGAVGRSIVEHLASEPQLTLRLGARRIDRLPSAWHQTHEIMVVDLANPDALAAFCSGCDVIVNCTGPTHQVGDVVLRAAVAARADYVDAAGDETVFSMLQRNPPPAERRLVLSAGIMPGLTALLPRYLATLVGQPSALQSWSGGRDVFTKTAAEEYVASLGNGHGRSLAAWRGQVCERILTSQPEAEVPGFLRPVTCHPYLSQENERVARCLGLAEGSWYNVFEGQQIAAAFGEVQSLVAQGDLGEAADLLCQAAARDLEGRTRYQTLSLWMTGAEGSQSLVLRTNDGYRLSGAFAALTVLEVCAAHVPPGVHFAGEALAPAETFAVLQRSAAVQSCVVAETALSPGEEMEFEGGSL
ncbi:saccharopine dehydrogenase NADP-binding domain-containing protein [Pseudophaeobacter sp.]|uniref:saccharopine dehydrogenase NADP-binding domain-containing protein n=1 Tax=Pseudophaeobacter sp. TaxID=1971739 RepID=UPI00405A4A40